MKNLFYRFGLLAVSVFAVSACSDELDMGDNVKNSTAVPVIFIETPEHDSIADEKITASMKIISNPEGGFNDISGQPLDYDGNIRIKLRGTSSRFMEQQKYSFSTVDAKGKEYNTELIGLPSEHDWVLVNTVTDISLMRDALASDLWEKMGHWAPRTRTVEVVLNGRYNGVYLLQEKIKIGKHRLNINKLADYDNAGLDVTGGYIVSLNKYTEKDNTFESKQRGIPGWGKRNEGGLGDWDVPDEIVWTIDYPKKKNITAQQQEYIHAFVDSLENMFASDYWNDAVRGYRKYINVESFVDYLIHSEFMHNADGYYSSSYFYKVRERSGSEEGTFFAGPVWDHNFTMGNVNFSSNNVIDYWDYEGRQQGMIPMFWKQLVSDGYFLNLVKQRYTELRRTVLSEKSLFAFIDSYAAMVDEAKDRHLEAFHLLKTDEYPGGGVFSVFMENHVSSYEEEISNLKDWISRRLAFMDTSWLLE